MWTHACACVPCLKYTTTALNNCARKLKRQQIFSGEENKLLKSTLRVPMAQSGWKVVHCFSLVIGYISASKILYSINGISLIWIYPELIWGKFGIVACTWCAWWSWMSWSALRMRVESVLVCMYACVYMCACLNIGITTPKIPYPRKRAANFTGLACISFVGWLWNCARLCQRTLKPVSFSAISMFV